MRRPPHPPRRLPACGAAATAAAAVTAAVAGSGAEAAGAAPRCVFVHGAGSTDADEPTATDTGYYWGGPGHIEAWTPFCGSRSFLHQDTVRHGWDDEVLLSQACDELVRTSGRGNEIRDTVVITHSMGNLIFAEALRRNRCMLGASSQWISIDAPWRGTPATPWIRKICSNESISSSLRWLATEISVCDPDKPGSLFHSYTTLGPDYPGLSRLLPVAKAHVTASMCGASPYGLTSPYSVGLEAVSAEVGYGEDNDGLLGFSSCKLPGRTYGEHFNGAHYLASANHMDGTCRYGNGDFGYPSRQPCRWLAGAFASASATAAPGGPLVAGHSRTARWAAGEAQRRWRARTARALRAWRAG